jgi:Raf kinase inhibitor-like YbhB/YbcL family protein
MRRTALAVLAASIFSLAACGGDDTSTAGGSGTGGGGGSGGSSGSGGSAAGSGGTTGGGGQAGTSGDASSGTDARADTPTGTPDVSADRPSTMDVPATDTGSSTDTARDTTSQPDGTSTDTGGPPDGTADATPPMDATTDGPRTDASGGSDAAGDGTSSMVLTSTAFTEGMTIPPAHTCAGTNESPPLSWTPGPPGTLSYAVVLTDKTNNLVHAGIYDIPANVTSLPQNVEKVALPSNPAGSKQVTAYNGMYGYAGPCPGATAHTYEFMLYAVDVATLPGMVVDGGRTNLVTALQAHDLATATLTGKATSLR